MRLLLDTHIALWLLTDDPKLSEKARNFLKYPARDIFYSVASLWEIAIKRSIGGLPCTPTEVADGMRESGFSRLSIEDSHLERVAALPLHHRDPFDRMLVAQAETEPLILLTVDQALAPYGPFVEFV